MALRLLVFIGLTIFCIVQAVTAVFTPSESGRNYLPLVYVVCPLLLFYGLGRIGLLTWPLVTVLLLARGHWVVGWIPVALVIYNLIGNELIRRRAETWASSDEVDYNHERGPGDGK